MIEIVWGWLDVGDEELAVLEETLAPEERRRAGRYVFPGDRRRFVAGRGLLRQVLGERLDRPPASLEIVVNRWGKPALGGPDREVSFNLSHSGPIVAVAVAAAVAGCPAVGVDVEVSRSSPVDFDVAERFFSPAECAALEAVAASDRSAAFLRGWTRKEAWVKARGAGLSIPLASFDVSLDRHEARLLRVDGDAGEPGRWSMHDVSGRYFGMEVIAAVAIEDPAGELSSRLWAAPDDDHGTTSRGGVNARPTARRGRAEGSPTRRASTIDDDPNSPR